MSLVLNKNVFYLSCKFTFIIFTFFVAPTKTQSQDSIEADSLAYFKTIEAKGFYYVRLSERAFLKDVQLAREYAQKALKIGKNEKNLEIETLALLSLAEIEKFSDFSKVLEYFNEIEQKINKIDKLTIQESFYSRITNFYLAWEQYDLARFYIEKHFEFAQKHKLSEEQLYANMAVIYARQKETEKAIKEYKKLISLREEQEHPSIYSDMGNAYYFIKDFEKAEEYYRQGVKIAQKYKDDRSMGYLKDNLGLALYAQEKYEEAGKWQIEALESRRKVKSELGLVTSLNNLSRTYLKLNMPDSALVLLQESKSISLSLNKLHLSENTLYFLGKTYKQLGNLDSAYFYMEITNDYQDSLRTLEKEKTLKNADAGLEIQKQRYENQLLNQRNETLYLTIIFVSIFLILIIVLSFLLFRQNQAKNYYLKKLQELNTTKDKLFAIIGHDLRSPINSLKTILELFHNNDIDGDTFKTYTDKLNNHVNTTFYSY